MGKQSLWKRFKEWIGGIGWDLFIWGQYDGDEEKYMDAIRWEVAKDMDAGLCDHPDEARVHDGDNEYCLQCSSTVVACTTNEPETELIYPPWKLKNN